MEAKLKSNPAKPDEWVECESKKLPGRKYLFNKTTGESKWLSPKKNEESVPVLVKKEIKAPANERLKRLQQKLRFENETKKGGKKDANKKAAKPNTPTATKEKPNVSNKSSSSPLKKIALSPQERLKQKEQKPKTEKDVKKSPRKTKQIVEQKLKRESVESNKKNNDVAKKEKSLLTESVKIKKPFKIPKKVETDSTSKAQSETTSSKVSKASKKAFIAQECLKSIEEAIDKQEQVSSKKLPTPKIDTISKKVESFKKENQTSTELPHLPAIVAALPDYETPELKFLTNMPNRNSTPVTHLKRSANQRLERLREKLEKENKDVKESIASDRNSNFVTNSFSISNDDMDYEEMDWEPSVEMTPTLNVSAPAVHSEILEKPTDMEVDDNLMLNAADKTFDTNINSKWRPTSTYIVLDTNIFIQHLSFIEFLKNEKPTDADGIIFYLPYTVLQELDKLKLRENIKHQVQKAIRYLNKMFETKDEHIQAQSALEHRRHLIDIEVSDDNILNCCLQVGEHIPKIILLSEDINLRNKAMCNDISVFTKSDFLKNGFQKSLNA